MWQIDTYLITYLRIILSTLIDKQTQREERRASKHKDKKGERASIKRRKESEQELSLNKLFYYLRFWRLSKQRENHSQALTKRKSPLTWKSTNASSLTSRTLIFNCGKSLYKVFLLFNPRISSDHETINSIISSIFTQCISGHSNIKGNESTNRAAKEAALSTLKQPLAPTQSSLYHFSGD